MTETYELTEDDWDELAKSPALQPEPKPPVVPRPPLEDGWVQKILGGFCDW